MIRIHQLSQSYHKRPSELLFPNQLSPMLQLAIDNMVFDIGYAYEARIKNDFEVEKLKCLASIMTGAKLK